MVTCDRIRYTRLRLSCQYLTDGQAVAGMKGLRGAGVSAHSQRAKLTICGVPSHHVWVPRTSAVCRRSRRCPAFLAAANSFTTNPSKPQKADTSFQYLELNLPPPVNTKVFSSKFVKSSNAVADCPANKTPEFAVIGRSNAGKSSIINCMTNNPKLAKVSKEPGMTKLINHFLINDSWFLVDLPGYGFSKTASKVSRNEWLAFTKDYFIKRDSLAHVLLLVDCSLPPQPVDIECANWLAECEVPFAVVFTKLDNRKKDGPSPQQNIRAFKMLLAKDFEQLPWCFETSSKTRAGRSELLGYISSVRQMYTAA